MQMPWRRFRSLNKEPPKEKERWAYVGRARLNAPEWNPAWEFWVYLHPTEDEWYFLAKKYGQAYPMGSYREWTRHYEFEPLVNKEN